MVYQCISYCAYHTLYYVYCVIWYDMIWSDMIWYDMLWYDMIWCDVIWYDIVEVNFLVHSFQMSPWTANSKTSESHIRSFKAPSVADFSGCWNYQQLATHAKTFNHDCEWQIITANLAGLLALPCKIGEFSCMPPHNEEEKSLDSH